MKGEKEMNAWKEFLQNIKKETANKEQVCKQSKHSNNGWEKFFEKING